MTEQSNVLKMNFLRKKLKNIEIEGEITTLGEYHDDLDFRMYQGVTINDKENNQLFLSILLIPKSLIDQVRIGEKVHLKMTRIKTKEHLSGAVYALLSTKDDNWYYDSLNSPKAINAYVKATYKRASAGPGGTMMFTGFLFVMLWAGMGIPLREGLVTGVLSGVLALLFGLWPSFIAPRLTGVNDFIASLKDSGCRDIRGNANSDKY
jgi:hypothetical protein